MAILQLSCWPRCRNTGCGYRLTKLGLHCGEEKHLLNICEPSKALTLVTDLELNSRHALVELVRNMTNRSIPIPHPPVGGNPCSSLLVPRMSTKHKRRREKVTYASTNVSSMPWISSSPASFCLAYTSQKNSTTQSFHKAETTNLLLKSRPLFERIVQLSVCVTELLSAHEPFETFTQSRSRPVPLGQRGHDLGVPN